MAELGGDAMATSSAFFKNQYALVSKPHTPTNINNCLEGAGISSFDTVLIQNAWLAVAGSNLSVFFLS